MNKRRRLITVLKIAAALIIVVAAVNGIATFILGRKVEHEIARIKASGAIVSLAQIADRKIPEGQNAAVVYEKAFREMDRGRKPGEQDDRPYGDLLALGKDRSAAVWEAAASRAAAQQHVIALVAEAVELPECRFSTNWEDGFNAKMTYLAKMRQLGRLLAANAMVAARQGRTDDAIRLVGLGFRMSESLRDEPTLIGLLARCALLRAASQALRETMDLTKLNEAQVAQMLSSVPRSGVSDSVRTAMQGERAGGIWFFDAVRRREVTIRDISSDALPLFVVLGNLYTRSAVLYRDELGYLRYMEARLAHSGVPYRKMHKQVPYEDPLVRSNIAARIIVPAYDRVIRYVDGVDAELRVDRAALALVATKQRSGSYPATLAALKALPELSLEDPFSGKDFIYKPQGKGFVLYSIGPNLRDDGGKAQLVPSSQLDKVEDDIVWRMDD